jgi:Zn-dependent peptidase ImmA (M78 family)/DNA-binding XRE family transcriptional regulator
MPAGTPGFLGERLRELREVRGLRQNELSEMLSVSPQVVSNYESGRKTPSPATTEELASKLNVPFHYFTVPIPDTDAGAVYFRSMAAATKTARRRAGNRRAWLEAIVVHLERYVSLPPVSLPEVNTPSNPLQLTLDDAESAADIAREFWRMSPGPVGNVVHLLENHGVVVARDTLGSPQLDSLSCVSSRPYVVIGTDRGTAVRWRFDAAHELGHILLHSRVDESSLTRPTEYKAMEQQANRFASAFLMPERAFTAELYSTSLDALIAMKQRWNVSIQSMVSRAHDIGLLDDEQSRRLWINISRRGWRTREPLDDTIQPETPKLLRRAVKLVLTEGGQSIADLTRDVALSRRDIEALCGLEPGELDQFESVPVALRGKEAEIYDLSKWRREGAD